PLRRKRAPAHRWVAPQGDPNTTEPRQSRSHRRAVSRDGSAAGVCVSCGRFAQSPTGYVSATIAGRTSYKGPSAAFDSGCVWSTYGKYDSLSSPESALHLDPSTKSAHRATVSHDSRKWCGRSLCARFGHPLKGVACSRLKSLRAGAANRDCTWLHEHSPGNVRTCRERRMSVGGRVLAENDVETREEPFRRSASGSCLAVWLRVPVLLCSRGGPGRSALWRVRRRTFL